MPEIPDLGHMRCIPTARLMLEPQMTAHAEAMFAVLQDPEGNEFCLT